MKSHCQHADTKAVCRPTVPSVTRGKEGSCWPTVQTTTRSWSRGTTTRRTDIVFVKKSLIFNWLLTSESWFLCRIEEVKIMFSYLSVCADLLFWSSFSFTAAAKSQCSGLSYVSVYIKIRVSLVSFLTDIFGSVIGSQIQPFKTSYLCFRRTADESSILNITTGRTSTVRVDALVKLLWGLKWLK